MAAIGNKSPSHAQAPRRESVAEGMRKSSVGCCKAAASRTRPLRGLGEHLRIANPSLHPARGWGQTRRDSVRASDGLGRYGDPVNPNADMAAMAKLRSYTPSGSVRHGAVPFCDPPESIYTADKVKTARERNHPRGITLKWRGNAWSRWGRGMHRGSCRVLYGIFWGIEAEGAGGDGGSGDVGYSSQGEN